MPSMEPALQRRWAGLPEPERESKGSRAEGASLTQVVGLGRELRTRTVAGLLEKQSV